MLGTATHAQRSFDDLGTPLADVTFCVLDLETTGGSPTNDQITEIGAVKVRGGEWLGTFHTLVNPGRAIPPQITVLTGITEAMVIPAPPVREVLPSLVEFLGDAVVVGHNVRFDVGFLNAAFERHGWPKRTGPVIDTNALARRLVRDEVPNTRLGTLADRFRLDHRPNHRALDDALATCDLLHVLLERAAAFGVLGLDDLVALPKLGSHPQVGKLKLTNLLPRAPGIYIFRDGRGEALYVGKATNLRQRVRSYFSGEERRMVGPLLRETQRIDHVVCAHPLEAAVTEVRLIHTLLPRYNRQFTKGRHAVYVALTSERFPRLSIVRRPPAKALASLGPLASKRYAELVVEAIHSAVPLRRCSAALGASPTREAPCSAAQLGVATCPCSGQIDERAYRRIVDDVVAGLTTEPTLLLDRLGERMQALAAAHRYEEAAMTRDRAAALASALARRRQLEALQQAGTIDITLADGSGFRIDRGRLAEAWPGPGETASGAGDRRGEEQPAPMRLALEPPTPATAPSATASQPGTTTAGAPATLPAALADEMACIAGWLAKEGHRARLEACAGTLASPLPRLPSFAPIKR